MAENIIHELNTKFNDMELKSKNKSGNMVVWQENSNVSRKSNNYDREDHALMDSKGITHICTLCGGNLYAVITEDNVLKENLLICPRGCGEAPNTYNIQPIGAENHANYQQRTLPHSSGGHLTNYNPHRTQDMAAMQNHDFRFNLTTDLMAAQTAHLMQLLDTIDCDKCHSKHHKEKPNRFKASKRRNVRRTEYELSGRKTYRSNGASTAPDFSSDLSSMTANRLHRFYEQLECSQGCRNCGDT